MKEIEYKGIWWLPGNEENYISGILKFNSDEGAHLELIGQLAGYENLETDIIIGKTSNGTNITLYKCFEINKTFSSNGFPTTIIFANMIFEGVQFNSEEDIKFNEVSCHFSNLDEWAWMNAINIDMLPDNELEIKYKLPEKLRVDISEEYTVEIYPKAQTPRRSIVQKEANIIQKIYVKVINKKNNSFEELKGKLQHVQHFISLGIGEPIAVMEVIGETEANKEEFDGKFLYPKVTMYYCIKQPSKAYKTILPLHMLFNLRHIKDEFEVVLSKWFSKEEILKPVFNLYFGTLYNSHMYLEQKFSNLIQAIESYHRRSKINTEIDPDDHKKRINSIIESTDNKYKEWLGNRLTYSNEPSLRRRLNDLIDECNKLINISSSKEKKSFVSKVCDTRNYFTHYDVSLTYKAAKGVELLHICRKLKIILEFNLLLEIGFSSELAFKLISDKYSGYNSLD